VNTPQVNSEWASMKTLEVKGGEEWKRWLKQFHLMEREVWLVFYKKDSGKTTVTYEEAVDAALCFGWIDSAIRKMDDHRYARRFTPRKPNSDWSKSNIERLEKLKKEGKMTEWGLASFRKKHDD
jgi:uncharacterized protein YdeI (YjbR/CyaY-like superfamily)